MTVDQLKALVSDQLNQMAHDEARAWIQDRLVEPSATRLAWEYGDNEIFDAWVFADLRERDVVAVHCSGGHGRRGCPWGIIFRNDTHFGQDCAWYPSLELLVLDGWVTPSSGGTSDA